MSLTDRAATTPERTALIDADDARTLSYRELDAAVDGVAARLREVLPDDGRLGTRCRPSAAFVVTYHAARRLGSTVVGLDPRLPEDTVAAHVDRAGVDAVVTDEWVELDCPVLLADQLLETIQDIDHRQRDASDRERDTDHRQRDAGDGVQTAHDDITHPRARGASRVTGGGDGVIPDPRPGNDHTTGDGSSQDGEPAVVLFTSGTTGEQRGVRLTERNLRASAVASAFRLGVSPEDRWLCCLPVHHMGGLAPVVRTALYGTTLVVQRAFDAGATAELFESHDVTGVSLVPTQLRRLLEAGAPLDALETVLVGGAPVPGRLRERALAAGVALYPTYGLTEAASQVATALPAEAADHPGTVGQPLYGTRVTVVGETGPVEPGEEGELVVSGPTVTPGYLDESATEAAVGEFGLHTGDVGYRDEAGRLWVLGRRDDLVVTGGELVAPAEVAETLRAHPAVADAAVVGLEDPEWGEALAALVVPEDPTEQQLAATLESHCRDRLPGYKRPKTVALADAIPRTQSGTVDRTAVCERLRGSE
jgi:O-succinylbenzoic acid--CoA ligase